MRATNQIRQFFGIIVVIVSCLALASARADWLELEKLTVADINSYDAFGTSVSISGDYAIVGAYMDDDSGSAYMFEQVCPAADLNDDCSVQFQDYAVFTRNWKRTDCAGPDWCEGADLNQLGQVNGIDLRIFVSLWLDSN
jgi:hypothetical protein